MMARDRKAEIQLSKTLQTLATAIDDALRELAGETVPFVVVIQVDKAAQYVSNCSRADGCDLLEKLLARWKSGAPDVMEHEKN